VSQTALESVARPKQARSRETLRRLLEAAEQLILEKGLADASIPEIVRRAGSSVGGFYARFHDKNELLRALEERFVRDVSRRVDELVDETRWRGATLASIVEAAAGELVGIARDKHNLIAAFLHRAVHDEAFKAEALRFRQAIGARVSGFLLGRRDELTHPDPALGVDLGIQFAFALMLQTLIVPDVRAAGRALSDAELAREIARNFLAYVGAPLGDVPFPDSAPNPA
jgi:AcrR family transcriptional regulator